MRPLTHQNFFVELTNHCNMHCSFCPSDELSKQRRLSEDDLVEKCIRQIADIHATSCRINFSILGEPLLNKRLFHYMSLCTELGIKCCVITNLTLLTQQNIEKLLSFDNLVLALSVQTPTPESYKIRGYKHMDFEKYIDTIERVVLTKFRMKSQAWIEVHIAGNHTPPNLFRESGKPLWAIYANASEQKAVIDRMIERCQKIAAKAKAAHEDFYNSAIRPDHVSEDHRPLSDNPDVQEHEFWGWMFAPNVFFRVKEFGLWGLQENFLNKFLDKTEKLFLEEAEGGFACPMAQQAFSMLADGQFTACCLDYDGEIDFGNIREKTASQAFWSIDRSRLLADASSHPSCRRCQGKAYIFDTSPINAPHYEVKMFGRGWYMNEPFFGGQKTGRWTNGNGTFYLYGRAFISSLTLEFISAFPKSSESKLIISKLSDGASRFEAVRELTIPTNSNEISHITVPVNLEAGYFYRLQLTSPSFIPCNVQDSVDRRRLGLAVFGIEACYVKTEATGAELVDEDHLEAVPTVAEKTNQKRRPTFRVVDRTPAL